MLSPLLRGKLANVGASSVLFSCFCTSNSSRHPVKALATTTESMSKIIPFHHYRCSAHSTEKDTEDLRGKSLMFPDGRAQSRVQGRRQRWTLEHFKSRACLPSAFHQITLIRSLTLFIGSSPFLPPLPLTAKARSRYLLLCSFLLSPYIT